MVKTLDQWRFAPNGRIEAKVVDGERLPEGQIIATSKVVARDPETNTIRTSSGSIYMLLEHSGEGYPPDMVWNDHGWIAGGLDRQIPRINEDAPTRQITG